VPAKKPVFLTTLFPFPFLQQSKALLFHFPSENEKGKPCFFLWKKEGFAAFKGVKGGKALLCSRRKKEVETRAEK